MDSPISISLKQRVSAIHGRSGPDPASSGSAVRPSLSSPVLPRAALWRAGLRRSISPERCPARRGTSSRPRPACPRAERLRSIRPARKSRRRRRFRFGRIFRLTLDQESHHLGCVLADIETHHIFVEFLCARRRDGDRIQAVRHQDAVHHEASRAPVPVEIKLLQRIKSWSGSRRISGSRRRSTTDFWRNSDCRHCRRPIDPSPAEARFPSGRTLPTSQSRGVRTRQGHHEAFRLRGLPPFAPFARAAAALAMDVARPAWRARALLIHSRVPNTPATSAGT